MCFFQLEIYIPQFSHYFKISVAFISESFAYIVTYLQENIFV